MSIDVFKEQIIESVISVTVQLRTSNTVFERHKILERFKVVLDEKLNELISETLDEGFTQGQNNVWEAMNG
jgi:hypothetical protein